MRRTSIPIAIAIFLAVLAAGGGAAAQERDLPEGDCSLPTSGAIPLTDLGTDEYQGFQGGLYPGGVNEIPSAHHEAGIAVANRIVPRDEAGNPDPGGVIGFVSIGVSNTFREFRVFETDVAVEPTLDPVVRFANAAQGGAHLTTWLDPNGRNWDVAAEVIADAGLTAEQVQAAWVKIPERIDESQPREEFPSDALTYRDELTVVLQMLSDRFPNLEIAYVTSRIYGGYNNTNSPSPEPIAYQHGFGVKWTVEAQIEGDPALDFAARAVPWLAWGPYMWADGTNPRGDGLTWECRDIRADGVHPTEQGSAKVSAMLIDFLRNEPTAAWMWTDRKVPAAVAEVTTTTSSTPTTTAPSTTVTTTPDRDRATRDSRSTTSLPPAAADRDQPAVRGSGDGPGVATWIGVTVAVAAAVGAAVSALRQRSG